MMNRGAAMRNLTLAHVERALAGYSPSNVPDVLVKTRCAVAALLRYEREVPDVLLMKRVDRSGDRWSGHVSFPGGRAEATDRDIEATAVRETREEVGLNLDRTARRLGRLDAVLAKSRGLTLPMSVTPFVYVQTAPEPLALGDEAESAFWLPLDRAASGELDSSFEYKLGPVPMGFPCWRYEDKVIWGLTHRMLVRFLQILDSR
jgi:8-oxo-dGTP pyrophosphatase MutT (NUDIX family)